MVISLGLLTCDMTTSDCILQGHIPTDGSLFRSYISDCNRCMSTFGYKTISGNCSHRINNRQYGSVYDIE